MSKQSLLPMRVRRLVVAFLGVAALVVATGGGNPARGGQQEKSTVKLSATAGKIDGAGKQSVTIKMEISPGWHAYANPVKNEDFEAAQTIVSITSPKKLEKVEIAYPLGKEYVEGKDRFLIYEGTVEIKAALKRAPGDTSPLEVTVKFMTCNDKECLPPETVKLQVK